MSACSKAVSLTFDSHVKCNLHHAFTDYKWIQPHQNWNQQMATCPTVKKLDKVPETGHQNCLLIVTYHFWFLLKWNSGHLPVPLGMWNNGGKHCSVVNASTVGNNGYVLVQAPALWLDRMTIMIMRMDKLFSNCCEIHQIMPTHSRCR
jgi:hypothetical protein